MRPQALPHTPAATALLSSRLEALAVGSLLPPAAAAGAGADEEAAEAHAASVLACLAAGPCGGRLSAMLCSALGVDWADSSAVAAAGGGGAPAAAADSTAAAAQQGRSRAGSRAAAVLSAAARASGPDGGAEQGDDVACMACGSDQGGDRMMLCDGCDAALHMDCLQPPLDSVPEGDWLCPGCCAAVRDSDVPDAAALQYLRLLLLSDSGRALLLRSGALKQAVPLLQSRAGAAAAAGVAAAGGWQHREDVLGALQAVLLYARAAVHLLSQGVEEEPALLARGGWVGQLWRGWIALRACPLRQQQHSRNQTQRVRSMLAGRWVCVCALVHAHWAAQLRRTYSFKLKRTKELQTFRKRGTAIGTTSACMCSCPGSPLVCLWCIRRCRRHRAPGGQHLQYSETAAAPGACR